MSVIVAGRVYVDEADRDRFVEGHRNIVAQAREQPGCVDVSISADPLEPGRVNLFEHFESEEALERWRAMAPAPTTSVALRGGDVLKHTIARSGPPFDQPDQPDQPA